MKITPRTRVPDLSFATVGGGSWSVAEQSPEHFTVLFFYRGHH